MQTLMACVRDFLSARDVNKVYARNVLSRCASYAKFVGRSVHVGELNYNDANRWLTALQAKGTLTPATIDGYRRCLLAVWNDAYENGLTETPPLRVKKIKVPRVVIQAYTHAELRKLLHAAENLKGRHRNGNRRADFWQAMIHAAYSTALRRSDLLRVFKRDIDANGFASVIQGKTGHIVRVKFSPETLKFAGRLTDYNGLLLPWPYHIEQMVPRFDCLKRAAGVNRGSLKWIRRSAASYAERDQIGGGSRLLGHRSPEVFRESYNDATISGERPVEPPRLEY